MFGVFKEQNADTFSSRQPSLLYVRATLMIAQYKPIAALEDLCQINIINRRLFPAKLVMHSYRYCFASVWFMLFMLRATSRVCCGRIL